MFPIPTEDIDPGYLIDSDFRSQVRVIFSVLFILFGRLSISITLRLHTTRAKKSCDLVEIDKGE